MIAPIRILGDRVLVALPPKEHQQETTTGYTYQAGQTTSSGILLVKPADVYNIEIATRGIVVQVGEKAHQVDLDEVLAILSEQDADDLDRDEVRRAIKRLGPAPFDVAVGDCVLFGAGAGEQFDYDGVSYLMLREDDILGVVEPLNSEAAA